MGNLSPTMGITMRTATALVILADSQLPAVEDNPAGWYKGAAVYDDWRWRAGRRQSECCAFTLPSKARRFNRVMPIAFTSPLFGALMGVMFAGEPLTPKTVFGMLLTVGGIIVLTI